MINRQYIFLIILLMLLASSCSNKEVMFWWDMMESHAEYERVTAHIEKFKVNEHFASSSSVVLTDSTIAYIEGFEAMLFKAMEIQDRRNEHIREPDRSSYSNYKIPSAILIGEEPGLPLNTATSAHALRIRLEDHKRELERLNSMPNGELDIFLFTEESMLDISGILDSWETRTFYHVPFALVIERLTRMKIALRLMEYEVLARIRSTETLNGRNIRAEPALE